MAVERKYLYKNDITENMQEFYNYLLENAVPKYFNSVKFEETESLTLRISCYIGEKVFLKFETGTAWSELKATINALNSVTSTIGLGRTSGGYTPPKVVNAYKCGNSLSFCLTESNSDMMNRTAKITITKDNAGNTAVICLNSSSIATSSTNTIYTANSDSVILSLTQTMNRNEYGLTAKVPFFVGNSGNYTPDVFLLPYMEYSGSGILEIDGVYYISNGLWCCKE